MIKEGIQKVVSGQNLTKQEATEIMKEIMSGNAVESQIAAFLVAMKMKGENAQEITAFASVMREFCCNIHPKAIGRIVDTCGTGGDKLKTFNISTTAAFIVAGAGVTVAKHGNRSVTSKSGSADMLEKLGLNLELEPQAAEKVIEDVGIGFMFAPKFHPAMKHAMGARRAIGIPTVFNLLGPLTNPANALSQVLGVHSEKLLTLLAETLKRLGSQEAMVVHGLDGLDEISTLGRTSIAWLKNGEVSSIEITPERFGFKKAKLENISGTTPEESAELTFRILSNNLKTVDPRRDIVLLNAAAGIVVSGKVENLSQGVNLAAESLESGRAYEKLRSMIKASNGDLSRLEGLEKKYA
jgi:anthranilate phosphoribosyltransferase